MFQCFLCVLSSFFPFDAFVLPLWRVGAYIKMSSTLREKAWVRVRGGTTQQQRKII